MTHSLPGSIFVHDANEVWTFVSVKPDPLAEALANQMDDGRTMLEVNVDCRDSNHFGAAILAPDGQVLPRIVCREEDEDAISDFLLKQYRPSPSHPELPANPPIPNAGWLDNYHRTMGPRA